MDLTLGEENMKYRVRFNKDGTEGVIEPEHVESAHI